MITIMTRYYFSLSFFFFFSFLFFFFLFFVFTFLCLFSKLSSSLDNISLVDCIISGTKDLSERSLRSQ